MWFPMPDVQEITVALLTLLRVGVLVIFMPVTGHPFVPPPVKVGIVTFLTILFVPQAVEHMPAMVLSPVMLALMALQEVLLAGLLAMTAKLIFTAVQFAGQLLSFQMGLAMSSVFDPSTTSQMPIIGQLAVTIALLLWMISGAELMMIKGFADSFAQFPVGTAWNVEAWQGLSALVSRMFVIALKIMAPVLLLMLMVYVALGLVSRAVPQIQVFFVSYPLTIGLGLFLFSVSLPAMAILLNDVFSTLDQHIDGMLELLRGRHG